MRQRLSIERVFHQKNNENDNSCLLAISNIDQLLILIQAKEVFLSQISKRIMRRVSRHCHLVLLDQTQDCSHTPNLSTKVHPLSF